MEGRLLRGARPAVTRRRHPWPARTVARSTIGEGTATDVGQRPTGIAVHGTTLYIRDADGTNVIRATPRTRPGPTFGQVRARTDQGTSSDDADSKEAWMSGSNEVVEMPTEVSERVGFFDRFAGWASHVASRATFFAFCVLLIVIWAPSILVIGNVDTWQLIINTATTCITFLMVALLQNSQTRADQAVQHKLNAIADGLGDLMSHLADGGGDGDLRQDMVELRRAVGLETHEGTAHNHTEPGSSNGSEVSVSH